MGASTGTSEGTVGKSDTEQLHELGYAQELKRGMGAFSNFAVSFTIISILSGCLTLFGYGMLIGGPASSAYGWPLVGILVTFVALAMAEICSSYPTAGGLYYWSAKVAPKNGPVWSWFTGWFNLLGQVAVTAGIDFGFAAFFCAFLNIAFDVQITKLILVGTYTGILILHALMNTFGIRLVALLNDVSVWWHVAGVLIIFAILFAVPSQHTSWSTIFNHQCASPTDCTSFPAGFINGTGFSSGFLGSKVYIFLIGLLLAQYTLTGYDASAHMTEETHTADISGPNGIWRSVVVSVIFGWILLLGVWYAVQGSTGYSNALSFQLATANVAAPAQIFLDAVGKTWTIFMLLIVLGAQFFCGMSSVTANSRMMYAFSRDGAIPGHKYWHRINRRTRTPTNSIWLAVVLAWLLVAPAYWRGSAVAYYAATAIAVIGLYIAYVIPTFLRLRAGNSFRVGRWNLGRWSYLVGMIAVIWVVFICIILMMPQYSPGGLDISFWNAFNFAPIAVAIVIGFAGIYWVVSARKWFKGPVVQGSPEELKAIERDLESV
ncbi:MAG TPA: amino acid permease [Actinomycetota bacterium]|nr:amino acid permease [Actinomycetota bacterium]